jgi:hypothetical protein
LRRKETTGVMVMEKDIMEFFKFFIEKKVYLITVKMLMLIIRAY